MDILGGSGQHSSWHIVGAQNIFVGWKNHLVRLEMWKGHNKRWIWQWHLLTTYCGLWLMVNWVHVCIISLVFPLYRCGNWGLVACPVSHGEELKLHLPDKGCVWGIGPLTLVRAGILLKWGISASALLTFGAESSSDGQLSCALRTFSGSLSPYRQNAPSTPDSPTPGVTPKMSPDLVKCPLGENLPLVENHYLNT